jgi:hypothetical protein
MIGKTPLFLFPRIAGSNTNSSHSLSPLTGVITANPTHQCKTSLKLVPASHRAESRESHLILPTCHLPASFVFVMQMGFHITTPLYAHGSSQAAPLYSVGEEFEVDNETVLSASQSHHWLADSPLFDFAPWRVRNHLNLSFLLSLLISRFQATNNPPPPFRRNLDHSVSASSICRQQVISYTAVNMGCTCKRGVRHYRRCSTRLPNRSRLMFLVKVSRSHYLPTTAELSLLRQLLATVLSMAARLRMPSRSAG